MPKKTFSLVSLGCCRNTYDSEIVIKRFIQKGFVFKKKFKRCHTLIINTCGFIDKAKEEAVECIADSVDLKKEGKVKRILVFGCLVERYYSQLKESFPEVDGWWGIEPFSQRLSSSAKLFPSHLGFLKISEGCLHRCSYCAIPLIKGKLRSKPKEEIIKEVRFLDKRGVKELNIIGQDITSWGKDFRNNSTLAGLLKDILREINHIQWIRLMYTHPLHFTSELIDLIASEERICRYIDLPIQHINDRILKLMNRGTTKKEIISLIDKIRKKIPGIILRTSVIVGFPTEEEKEFRELLAFLKYARFGRLGAFIYSHEEDTPAYKLKQVHPSTKKKRFKQLMSLQREIAYDVNRGFLGKEMDVLVEENNGDVLIGRTQYDAYEADGIVFLKRRNLKLGKFYRAKIVDVYDYDFVAA
jgi:ribosomal protein S12 methylthiotransferase